MVVLQPFSDVIKLVNKKFFILIRWIYIYIILELYINFIIIYSNVVNLSIFF